MNELELRTRARPRRCLVDVRLPAEPASVPVLRHLADALAVAAGVREPTRANVALCVTEAVTNVVLHAYPEGTGRGEMRLTAEVTGDAFEVVVTDEGGGLAAHAGTEGGLGQGLSIIARLTTSFGIDQARDGGVALWMRFPLPRPAS